MNRVKITLHGSLATDVGRSEWNLRVKNVQEALSGVQSQGKKFYAALIKQQEKHIKYRVLLNGEDFFIEEGKDPDTLEGLRSSQLALEEIPTLKTIDIVPIIEGAGGDFWDIFTVIAGAALIWTGLGAIAAGAAWASMYGMAVIAGVGLLAAGITNLLTPDPEFDDFREVEGGGRPPYTFSGPINITKEGGPVFVGYGRLLVGSQVIQAAIDHFNEEAGVPKNENSKGSVIWGLTSYGIRNEVKGMGELVDSRVQVIGQPKKLIS